MSEANIRTFWVPTTSQEIGGAFGVAALVAVFSTVGAYASAEAFIDGFIPAIAAGAGISLVGAAVALGLPSRGQGLRVSARV